MDQKKPLGLSLIIPCFNEVKNIDPLLKKLEALSSSVEFPIEVIVVDGNSDDGTDKVLKKRFSELDSNIFSLILLESRKGYGFDILQGLKKAKYHILAWTHADLQTDVKDVEKAYQKLISSRNNKIIIKGNRKNRRILDVVFTFGMQVVVFFYLGTYLKDINAQPKVFTKDFYENYLRDGAPNDFSLDLYALFIAKKNNYLIDTISVYFNQRIHGEAKGGGGSWKNRLNLVKRTFKYIIKLSKY